VAFLIYSRNIRNPQASLLHGIIFSECSQPYLFSVIPFRFSRVAYNSKIFLMSEMLPLLKLF